MNEFVDVDDEVLFEPTKEQKRDLEEYLKKRYMNPLEEWRQKTHNATKEKLPLYLKSTAKKTVPERITVYYST